MYGSFCLQDTIGIQKPSRADSILSQHTHTHTLLRRSASVGDILTLDCTRPGRLTFALTYNPYSHHELRRCHWVIVSCWTSRNSRQNSREEKDKEKIRYISHFHQLILLHATMYHHAFQLDRCCHDIGDCIEGKVSTSDFDMKGMLGQGAYARVMLAEHKASKVHSPIVHEHVAGWDTIGRCYTIRVATWDMSRPYWVLCAMEYVILNDVCYVCRSCMPLKWLTRAL